MSLSRKLLGVGLILLLGITVAGCGGGGGSSDGGTTPPPGGGSNPPLPPTGLVAQRDSIQVTHVNMAWTASPTAGVGYRIYRKLNSQATYTVINTVAGTNYTDSTIDPAVAFDRIDYYVTAVNADGESQPSNVATVPSTVPGGGGPPPPPPF